MTTHLVYSESVSSNTRVLEAIARDIILQEIMYEAGIPQKVDQVLRNFPELQEKPAFSAGQMRLELIAYFIFFKGLLPLGIIPDCEQHIWDTEDYLEEKWEQHVARDEKVTRAAKEVRWHATRKYHKEVQEIAATPELVHEYCLDNKLPPELEERLRREILSEPARTI